MTTTTVSIPMLDLVRQQATIAEDLERAVRGVIAEARYLSGEATTPFEARLAAYCGRAQAVGVASGTAALHIALIAAGIGPGDDVVTVPNSFFATTEVILSIGARPRFVDVEPDTHLMSLPALAEQLGERTRAVVPVHLFGNPVDVPALLRLLAQRGREDVVVIEDCAHALGAALDGRRVPLGGIGAFSFNPGKNLGALGDAGAIVTDDEPLADAARALRNHGRVSKNEHAWTGFNARLDRLHDRVLELKMEHLEAWNGRRRGHADRYDEAFAGVAGLDVLAVPRRALPARHQYVLRAERRDALRRYLGERGVASDVHYPQLIVSQPPLERLGWCAEQFPVASRLVRRMVSLPCFPELRREETDRVIELVTGFAAEEAP